VSNIASACAHSHSEAKAGGAGGVLPNQYVLSPNYPNPFNPTTTIDDDLPMSSQVLLTRRNVLGQNVSTLVDVNQPAGRYPVAWDGNTAIGKPTATGIYLGCMKAGSVSGNATILARKL